MRVEDHMPGLYGAAEDLTAAGQRRFRRLVSASLAFLVVAAAFGIIESPWAGWISAGAFTLSLVISALWILKRAESDWYDGRAAAESVKSLTWKFAMGGEPYGVGDPTAERAYRDALDELTAELRRLDSDLRAPDEVPDTAALAKLRSESLALRKGIYGDQRLDEQRGWYSRRAGEHRVRARHWQIAMVSLEALGIVAAALKGLDILDADLLSLMATAAAAVAAWLTAGDYVLTARAYDFAALELETAIGRLEAVDDEEGWATFAADAEQAMSREHTTWGARRRAHAWPRP